MSVRPSQSGLGNMNAKPAMFQAGLSNRFTKRHVANFHDTTLMAASAAKARADKKMERQADAIEKQQQKIASEMKKIEEITERLQRQQAREAKRLRTRLNYAATHIQRAFSRYRTWRRIQETHAANTIQRRWRGVLGRMLSTKMKAAWRQEHDMAAAKAITCALRVHVCRLVRQRELKRRALSSLTIQCAFRQYQARQTFTQAHASYVLKARKHHAIVRIQSHVRCYLTRVVYLDVLYLVCRIQAVARGFLVRTRLQWLLSINLYALTKFQAHVRGVVARRRIQPQVDEYRRLQQNLQQQNQRHLRPRRSTPEVTRLTAAPPSTPREMRAGYHKNLVATEEQPLQKLTHANHDTPKNTKAPPVHRKTHNTFVPVVRQQQSHWRPAGANVSTHLPRLPGHLCPSVAPRAGHGSNNESNTESLGESTVRSASHFAQRLRAKYGKHRPARLAPMHSGELTEDSDHSVVQGEEDTDDEIGRISIVRERRERDDELKRKLLARKLQERRRQEIADKLRQEEENEAMERKSMEREERLTRLVIKTLRRKKHDIRLKRLSVEQQREDRERIDMHREERITRLQLRLLARQELEMATEMKKYGVHNGEEDEPQQIVKIRANNDNDLSSDETDEDREAISHRVDKKENRSRRSPDVGFTGSKATNKKGKRHHRHRTSHPNSADSSNQDSIHYLVGAQSSEARRARTAKPNYAIEDDVSAWADFDYGNEFEDVVDEASLAQLIC